MGPHGREDQATGVRKVSFRSDAVLVLLSLLLQLGLGILFGHAYDQRIYLATGYLVGTGQNPYIPQNLTAVFHNGAFQGMTSVGYPPPWPLLTGLIYLFSYRLIPNLLLYNLALKLPLIAANFGLAYLVARVLKRLGATETTAHGAWVFMLFNPLVLYVSAAWGQFDSIPALLALLALVFLVDNRPISSALLLALSIAFKPTSLPLLLAVFLFLLRRPLGRLFGYFGILGPALIILCAGPFLFFHWDPSIILTHWNAQFSVGGGMSFLTIFELFANSYQLPGLWWLLGFLWVPALGFAAWKLKPGDGSLVDLLQKSTVLVLVFFLFRTWLSEPNLMLVLPMILILASLGELDKRFLAGITIVTLLYSFFNTSMFQLLFLSLPGLMDQLLRYSDVFRTARLVIRTLLVIPWLWMGAVIVVKCLRNAQAHPNGAPAGKVGLELGPGQQ